METKVCKQCNKELPLSFYHKEKKGVMGLRASCKDCVYARKDKDKMNERLRRWSKERTESGDIRYWNKRANVSNYRARKIYNSNDVLSGNELIELFISKPNCSYCNSEFSSHLDAKIDHIIPLVKGGTHSIDNIILCCNRCNSVKNDKDPEELFNYVKTVYMNLSKRYE